MSSCTPFINRTSPRKFHGFEGEISKIEGVGNPNFLHSLSLSFFYNQHTPLNAKCSNLAFLAHLPYLGDYLHSLGINAHNSNLNNRCMKRCTRTVWKTILVPFSKFSCLLQGMDRYFEEMCGNSQP